MLKLALFVVVCVSVVVCAADDELSKKIGKKCKRLSKSYDNCLNGGFESSYDCQPKGRNETFVKLKECPGIEKNLFKIKNCNYKCEPRQPEVAVTSVEVLKETDATLRCTVSELTAATTISWHAEEDGPALLNDATYVISHYPYYNKTQYSTLEVMGGENYVDRSYYCNVTAVVGVERAELNIFEVSAPDVTVAKSALTECVLTCTITGITQPVTVTWKSASGEDLAAPSAPEYTVDEGVFSATGEQQSTLTIAMTGVDVLGDTTPFTCVVKSGQYPASDEFPLTVTLTKLDDGDETGTADVVVDFGGAEARAKIPAQTLRARFE